MTDDTAPEDGATDEAQISGHAGELAVAVARAHGVETMFTLSGAHVFPMYDGAVKADPPMRLARRTPRADRGVRRRGHRQADPGARASPC